MRFYSQPGLFYKKDNSWHLQVWGRNGKNSVLRAFKEEGGIISYSLNGEVKQTRVYDLEDLAYDWVINSPITDVDHSMPRKLSRSEREEANSSSEVLPFPSSNS